MSKVKEKAVVVGSGPNGLAAAITLAQSGLPVSVYEKNEVIGGACRSSEIIRPGYLHDIGSAVHPLALVSPFLSKLSLEKYGLTWIEPSSAMAHPFDDGTAVLLKRSLTDTASMLDSIDSTTYRRLMEPLVTHWQEIISQVVNFPQLSIRKPFIVLNFGRQAMHSASGLAVRFKGTRAKAFFAGLGVHSLMNLDQRASAAAGLVLAITAHINGWSLPEGGAQKISDAMVDFLTDLGGNVITGAEVKSINQFPDSRLFMLDVTPRQFVVMTENQLPDSYKRKLMNYRYGPGVFKMDWILDGPVPWRAEECLSAGTIHLGGYFKEIVTAENEVYQDRHPEKPFVLLAQPSLFDQTRTSGNGHIVWGYCHVPNNSSVDMTDRIEKQIERFAPGFKDRIIARHIMSPSDIEKDNPNCIGGDIAAGLQSLKKMVFPGVSYETPIDDVFLCSAATPPGPGVHGMCGFRAAQFALKKLKLF